MKCQLIITSAGYELFVNGLKLVQISQYYQDSPFNVIAQDAINDCLDFGFFPTIMSSKPIEAVGFYSVTNDFENNVWNEINGSIEDILLELERKNKVFNEYCKEFDAITETPMLHYKSRIKTK